MRKLQLPATLVFTVVTSAACVGGSPAPTAVDGGFCTTVCFRDQYYDDGGVILDDAGVTCPDCASGPNHDDCGKNCIPEPIV